MARSSGGGSRSGGSRGGGSSSSSSRSHGGSGSGHRVSSKPFHGSRRFRYSRNGVSHYIYSNIDLRSRPDSKPRWLLLLFYIPFFFAMFGMWGSVFVIPEGPIEKSISSVVAVYDNGDVFTAQEEDALLKTLNRFTDSTGVVTQVVTVEWNEWQKSTSWFSDYAFNRYYVQFQDENCWLLVYSEKDGGLTDWEWEGVQGDNTYDVADVFIDDFNQSVQSALISSNDPDVDTAFIAALSGAIDDFESQKFRIDGDGLLPALFVTAFIVFHCGIMVFAGSNLKYSNKELIEVDENDRPVTTTYCNSNADNIQDSKLTLGQLQQVIRNGGDLDTLKGMVKEQQKNVEVVRHAAVEKQKDCYDSYCPSSYSQISSERECYLNKKRNDESCFEDIANGGVCHFCGKSYDKLESGRCPHCKSLLSY